MHNRMTFPVGSIFLLGERFAANVCWGRNDCRTLRIEIAASSLDRNNTEHIAILETIAHSNTPSVHSRSPLRHVHGLIDRHFMIHNIRDEPLIKGGIEGRNIFYGA